MKNVLIPYSSGLDSTYLVWKNLTEGNQVTVVYFEITNNDSKVILENIHRDYLIKVFQEEFPCLLNKSYMTYKVGAVGIINNYGLIQAPIWMLGAFLASGKDFDEIQMGYVQNDCAISYLEEIENLYEAFKPFSQQGKFPKITFPIIKKMKEEMINDLPSQYKRFTYSCENPNIIENNKKETVYKYCGHCVPCERYSQLSNFPEHIFINMSPELTRIYDKMENKFYLQYKDNEKICLTTATNDELNEFRNKYDKSCQFSNDVKIDNTLLKALFSVGVDKLSLEIKEKFKEEIAAWSNLEKRKKEEQITIPFTDEEHFDLQVYKDIPYTLQKESVDLNFKELESASVCKGEC